MGAKPLFAPPNNQTRIFLFCLFKRNKHERKQKQRQQYKENRVHFYILNERRINFVKSCRRLKKRSSEIFERIEGNFFKIFCLEVNLPKIFAPPIFVTQISLPNICDPNFCPPIFMTSLRLWPLQSAKHVLALQRLTVVLGQNGIGGNGTDKMVSTKWHR